MLPTGFEPVSTGLKGRFGVNNIVGGCITFLAPREYGVVPPGPHKGHAAIADVLGNYGALTRLSYGSDRRRSDG